MPGTVASDGTLFFCCDEQCFFFCSLVSSVLLFLLCLMFCRAHIYVRGEGCWERWLPGAAERARAGDVTRAIRRRGDVTRLTRPRSGRRPAVRRTEDAEQEGQRCACVRVTCIIGAEYRKSLRNEVSCHKTGAV